MVSLRWLVSLMSPIAGLCAVGRCSEPADDRCHLGLHNESSESWLDDDDKLAPTAVAGEVAAGSDDHHEHYINLNYTVKVLEPPVLEGRSRWATAQQAKRYNGAVTRINTMPDPQYSGGVRRPVSISPLRTYSFRRRNYV